MTAYNITPVTKPRQTRSDKWKKRPCVMRYRAFADQVRALGITFANGQSIAFILPMPKSWSVKKQQKMCHQNHEQTPDIDNLLKALLDALFKDDSKIHTIDRITKRWGFDGRIIIE